MLNKKEYIEQRVIEIDKKLDAATDPAKAVTLVNEKMRLLGADMENDKKLFEDFLKVLDILVKVSVVAIPAGVAVKQLKMQNAWFYDGLKFEETGTICSDMNKNVHRGLFRLH